MPAVDHAELRAIRGWMAQLLYDNNGDLPESFELPIELLLPEYPQWDPRISDDPDGVRVIWEPFGHDVGDRSEQELPELTLTNSRRFHAMLQGIRAYITDLGVESVIISDLYGPVGVRCFEDPYPRGEELYASGIGNPADPSKSQGAVLGHLMTRAIQEQTYEMCVDPERSPVSGRTLAHFVFLSQISGNGISNRLDELLAMDHNEILGESQQHLRILGAGGPSMLGRFMEVITEVAPDREPHEYTRLFLNSMDTPGPLLKAKPTAAKTAVRMLSWDGEGVPGPTTVLESGLPWNKRYFKSVGEGRDERIVFSPAWQTLVNPYTGRPFREDNRDVIADPTVLSSSEGCVALVRAVDNRGKRPTRMISSYARTAGVMARAAEQTSVFRRGAPRPVDLRDAPLVVRTGRRGLAEIDRVVAPHLPEHKAALSRTTQRREGFTDEVRTVPRVRTEQDARRGRRVYRAPEASKEAQTRVPAEEPAERRDRPEVAHRGPSTGLVAHRGERQREVAARREATGVDRAAGRTGGRIAPDGAGGGRDRTPPGR